MSNWLIGIVQTENNEIKKDILIKTFKTLLTFCEITSGHNTITIISTLTNEEKIFLNEPSSLFMIKILFKRTSKKEEKKDTNDFEQFEYEFRQKLWNSRSEINLNKYALECSQTIQEYYSAFPDFLNSFFFRMISELY